MCAYAHIRICAPKTQRKTDISSTIWALQRVISILFIETKTTELYIFTTTSSNFADIKHWPTPNNHQFPFQCQIYQRLSVHPLSLHTCHSQPINEHLMSVSTSDIDPCIQSVLSTRVTLTSAFLQVSDSLQILCDSLNIDLNSDVNWNWMLMHFNFSLGRRHDRNPTRRLRSLRGIRKSLIRWVWLRSRFLRLY